MPREIIYLHPLLNMILSSLNDLVGHNIIILEQEIMESYQQDEFKLVRQETRLLQREETLSQVHLKAEKL